MSILLRKSGECCTHLRKKEDLSTPEGREPLGDRGLLYTQTHTDQVF